MNIHNFPVTIMIFFILVRFMWYFSSCFWVDFKTILPSLFIKLYRLQVLNTFVVYSLEWRRNKCITKLTESRNRLVNFPSNKYNKFWRSYKSLGSHRCFPSSFFFTLKRKLVYAAAFICEVATVMMITSQIL